MGISDLNYTGQQVLSWVSVCSEVAGDLNFHFLLHVHECLCELNSIPEATCEGIGLSYIIIIVISKI